MKNVKKKENWLEGVNHQVTDKFYNSCLLGNSEIKNKYGDQQNKQSNKKPVNYDVI